MISLVASSLESLLDDVGKGNLVAGEEAGDGILLGLAEALLLRSGKGLVLVNGGALVALGKSVVGLDVSLKSCLHFRCIINYNY
jgi:hypothetical protein